jgi:hypothetical protein
VLREKLAKADPDSRFARSNLASAHERTAQVYLRLVDLPLALKHANRGVELREKLAADDPQDTSTRRYLAKAYICLSEVNRARADLLTVRKDLFKTVELTQKLAADTGEFQDQIEFALANFNVGSIEMGARRHKEAAKWMEHGVTLLEGLDTDGKLKNYPLYRDMLAQKKHKLAVCLKAEQAIDDLEFALGQPSALVPDLLTIRGTELASRGQHVSAAATAEKLGTLDVKNKGNAYNAACLYALCASSVGPADARKRYIARAIESLKTAVQLGYTHRLQIETDPDLAVIRQEQDYRALMDRLKELEKKSK